MHAITRDDPAFTALPRAGENILVDKTTRRRYPAASTGSLLLTAARFGWRGIIVEQHRLPPAEMPEHSVIGHGISVNDLTGFNETEAESSSHWMDDRANYIKLDTVTTFFNQILSTDDNRMDPQRMADAMVSIIPEDAGLFRNVVPKATEELARNAQRELWTLRIDRSPDMRR